MVKTQANNDTLTRRDQIFFTAWVIKRFKYPIQRGDSMSYKDHLDPHSELFHHANTRRKRTKSQVNGETMMTQNVIILRSNAKAHRW